jgi:hypothetical protein
MNEGERIEKARKAFAEVTGALEDATIIAAEGQASPILSAASQSYDRLIALLETTLAQLQRLRRRLG